MNTTHIYTLADPETGVIRYVGKANNLAKRYDLHVRKREQTKKSRWIQSLQERGVQPRMELLDIVPEEEWQFWEMYWIAQLKAWGYVLYNGDNGGLGSDRLPNEVRAKISKTLTGRDNPDSWIPYAQYDLQGNYIQTFPSRTAAAKATGASDGNIGRTQGTGYQARGFLWLKVPDGVAPSTIQSVYTESGRVPITDERRAWIKEHLSKLRNGRIVTEETRLKMRLAKLGKAPANKGVKQTEAQRLKNSETCTTKKPVVQYTLEGDFIRVFDSVKQASEFTGATRAGILKTCSGVNKHAGGYLWKRNY